MTSRQLSQIINFSRPFYSKTGEYHGWDHVLLVRKNALNISKAYKNINTRCLEAVCYLHDIGRSVKDEGHPEESFKLCKEFLRKIGVSDNETSVIKDAVISHDLSKILKSKTLEARILFDADKIEIISVRGFLRVILFLVEERKMSLDSSVDFLWKYVNKVYKGYIFTKSAKNLIKNDVKIINNLVRRYGSWN